MVVGTQKMQEGNHYLRSLQRQVRPPKFVTSLVTNRASMTRPACWRTSLPRLRPQKCSFRWKFPQARQARWGIPEELPLGGLRTSASWYPPRTHTSGQKWSSTTFGLASASGWSATLDIGQWLAATTVSSHRVHLGPCKAHESSREQSGPSMTLGVEPVLEAHRHVELAAVDDVVPGGDGAFRFG